MRTGSRRRPAAALKILNGTDYMGPAIKDFGEEYDVAVEVTPYTNYDQMLAKMRGRVPPSTSSSPAPPCSARWPTPISSSRSTTPTCPTSPTSGRSTRIPGTTRGALHRALHGLCHGRVLPRRPGVQRPENGYDLIWDEQYSGKVYLLDDMGEAIGMSLLRNKITTDINTSDPDLVKEATDSLIELIDLVKIKANVNAYSEVPEGTATIHQGWSGDPIAGQYYLPKGETTDVLGYWRPEDRPSESSAATTSRSRRVAEAGAGAPVHQRPARQRDRAAQLRLERLPATAHQAVCRST